MTFPSLKDLIGIDIKDILNKFVSIKIDRSVKTKVEVKEGGILAINYGDLDPSEKKKISELMRFSAIPSDKAIIEVKAKEKTLGIKEGLPKLTDKSLLEFYETKLSPEYIDALEIALVIKNEKFSNQPLVKDLKKDVVSKYPLFGSNLCNLVSEGYFHEHFKQLYESMIDEEDFEVRKYKQKIEHIVVSLPYTIFVSSFQSEEELSGLILYKLEKLKTYGKYRLIVHAFNVANVEKASKIITELISSNNIKVEYDPKRIGYMTAILWLEE